MDVLPLTRLATDPYLYLPPVHVTAVLSMLALPRPPFAVRTAAQVTEVVSSRLHCSPIPVSTKHRSRRTDEQNRIGPKARMNRGFMSSARVGSGIDRSGAENGKSSLHHQHFRLVRRCEIHRETLNLSESACRESEQSAVYAGTSLLVPSNVALFSLHASRSRGMDNYGSHMKIKCNICLCSALE
jgi:hypothetical protein